MEATIGEIIFLSFCGVASIVIFIHVRQTPKRRNLEPPKFDLPKFKIEEDVPRGEAEDGLP